MAYDMYWLDDDLRILSLRLFDPFYPEEIEGLKQALAPSIETLQPLFLFLDISEFRAFDVFSKTLSSDEMLLTNLEHHMKHSRIAIVGGGMFVRMMLGFLGSGDESKAVRSFKHEDQALYWLREQAKSQVGSS